MYVNLRPCLPCLAVAHAAGVRFVVFGETWAYDEIFEALYGRLGHQFSFLGSLSDLRASCETIDSAFRGL
jgi:hypothetical protein